MAGIEGHIEHMGSYKLQICIQMQIQLFNFKHKCAHVIEIYGYFKRIDILEVL